MGWVRSELSSQEVDSYQDKYGVLLKSPCVEIILVGTENQKFLFSERYFISIDNNHENDAENLIKLEKSALKKFYKSKKIKSGTLRAPLPFSTIKSFVLGNLGQVMKRGRDEEVFPFVLAHLKQHAGENLAQMRVDFTRVSDHEVWVVVCPKEVINQAMRMSSKKIPLVVVEPSLQSLRRVLRSALCSALCGTDGINEMFLKKVGLLWIDATPQGKRFRLTFCEGVDVVWDKILEGSPEGEIGQALSAYWLKIQGASYRMFQRFYLFIEPVGVESLIQEIQSFFKNTSLKPAEVYPIFPEQLGLKQADEFVSYGLALR
jgi:hypothetical protein